MKQRDRLAFCAVCQKSKLSLKKGLVCSITKEPAVFERSCANYKVDPILEKRKAQSYVGEGRLWEQYFVGLLGVILKHVLWAGVIFIFFAVIVFLVDFFVADTIRIRTFLIFIGGIVLIIKGLIDLEKRLKHERFLMQNQDVLDMPVDRED